MTRTALVLLLVLAQAASPPSGEDKGQIRGRVIDRETGQPLPSAEVHLTSPGSRNIVATTDDAGVFRFTRLPPGRYGGFAFPGRHRATHEMQPVTPGTSRIELAKDAVYEINIALPRTRVIPVRVVDEFGDPLSELNLIAYRAPSMQTAAVPFQQRTDDHGRLRIAGVPSGRYVVCAEAAGLASTQTARNAPRERLLRTCYPSAASEVDAEPITVGSGPVEEIEIRMRRGRTFSISGIVLDASGTPAGGAYRAGLDSYRGGGSSGSSFSVGEDGRFRINNVAPGDYAVTAAIGGPERPDDRRVREAAFIPIHVDNDIEDLVVTMQKGVDVPGLFVLEDASETLPSSQGSGLSIWARLANDWLGGTGSGIYDNASADRTFTLRGVFGQRVLHFQNVPRGWYVKHVRYRGRDIIDTPTDFARGTARDSLEVVMSNRGASMTGRVLDDGANPAPRAFVWLLRADGDTVSDVVAETFTSTTGEFRLGPLRQGEYVAVAFASRGRAFERSDRARAAKLVSLGERVRLTEFDERSIDLRVIKEEPR